MIIFDTIYEWQAYGVFKAYVFFFSYTSAPELAHVYDQLINLVNFLQYFPTDFKELDKLDLW